MKRATFAISLLIFALVANAKTLFLIKSGVATCSTCTTDLAHFWTLTEASGNRADSVGSATLIQNGTVPTCTGIGGLNGISQVNTNTNWLATASPVVPTGSFAFVYWIKPNALVEANTNPVASYINPGTSISYISIINTGTMRWVISTDGSGFTLDITNGASLSTGNWYMIYVYLDDAGNSGGLSVNNGTAVTGTINGTAFATSAGLGVGDRPQGGARPTACVSQVGQWNRTLTPTELSYLYNSGSGRTYSGGVFN